MGLDETTTKLTPQELDERMWDVAEGVPSTYNGIKQLIRDCIEAVTPEKITEADGVDPTDTISAAYHYNGAISDIEANAKGLLG